jgi:hypothetical protein
MMPILSLRAFQAHFHPMSKTAFHKVQQIVSRQMRHSHGSFKAGTFGHEFRHRSVFVVLVQYEHPGPDVVAQPEAADIGQSAGNVLTTHSQLGTHDVFLKQEILRQIATGNLLGNKDREKKKFHKSRFADAVGSTEQGEGIRAHQGHGLRAG